MFLITYIPNVIIIACLREILKILDRYIVMYKQLEGIFIYKYKICQNRYVIFVFQSSGAKDSVDNDIMMCVQAVSTNDKYV